MANLELRNSPALTVHLEMYFGFCFVGFTISMHDFSKQRSQGSFFSYENTIGRTLVKIVTVFYFC